MAITTLSIILQNEKDFREKLVLGYNVLCNRLIPKMKQLDIEDLWNAGCHDSKLFFSVVCVPLAATFNFKELHKLSLSRLTLYIKLHIYIIN